MFALAPPCPGTAPNVQHITTQHESALVQKPRHYTTIPSHTNAPCFISRFEDRDNEAKWANKSEQARTATKIMIRGTKMKDDGEDHHITEESCIPSSRRESVLYVCGL
jgi:hypothetical protein